jgi:hypothetical protein
MRIRIHNTDCIPVPLNQSGDLSAYPGDNVDNHHQVPGTLIHEKKMQRHPCPLIYSLTKEDYSEAEWEAVAEVR